MMTWRKMLNFFFRISSNTSSPLPENRQYENDVLINYLLKYPHLCSMKNFKVLDLIYQNQILTEQLEACKRRNPDQEELLRRIARKYGYEVSKEGYLGKRG